MYLPDTTNAISVNFLSKEGIVYTQYPGLNYLNSLTKKKIEVPLSRVEDFIL